MTASNYRFKTCEDCGGDGSIEGPLCHFNPVNGDAWGDVRPCSACDGSGTVCVEVEPVAMEDWAQ